MEDDAKMDKEITWCWARLIFSILVQDKNVNKAIVAYLTGQTPTIRLEPLKKTSSKGSGYNYFFDLRGQEN